MPFPDSSFDVVLCQMGLQFMDNTLLALKEMKRVLVPGGRLIVNLPGQPANIFSRMEESLRKHMSTEAAGFLNQVFSMHDKKEIQHLFNEAGFRKTDIQSSTKTLMLPPAEEFLWQYIFGTPLAALAVGIDEISCLALENEVKEKWKNFSDNGGTKDKQPMLTVVARN